MFLNQVYTSEFENDITTTDSELFLSSLELQSLGVGPWHVHF